MPPQTFSRRKTLGLLGAGGAAALLPGYAHTSDTATTSAASAPDLLDQIAWRLLAHYPEQATALGIDKDEHAKLRRRLEDKSPEGVASLRSVIESDLALVRRIPAEAHDSSTRTSLAAVERAYASALEGFALPYGEIAVGGWRNTPYVVIQNVGAYLDIPRFLDAGHPCNPPGTRKPISTG